MAPLTRLFSAIIAGTLTAGPAGGAAASAAPAEAGKMPRPSTAPQSAAPADAGAVGMVIDDGEPLPPGLRSRSPEARCLVLVRVGQEALASPERLDPILEAARTQGLQVGLVLTGEGRSHALVQEVDAWIEQIASLARRVEGRAVAWQILENPSRGWNPREYAFFLKRAAVVVRAAQPRARIVAGPFPPEDAAWVERLFDHDAGPYLDVITVSSLDQLEPAARWRDRLDPSAALWLVGVAAPAPLDRASALHVYADAREASAEAVLFVPRAEDLRFGEYLADLRALFAADMTPASPAALPFDAAAMAVSLAGPPETPLADAGVQLSSFFDPRTRDGVTVYRAARLPAMAAQHAATTAMEEAAPVPPAIEGGSAGPAAARAPARLTFPLRAPVESIDLFDPSTLTQTPIAGEVAAGRVVFLPVRPTPLVLRYRLAAGALPLQESSVGATSDLTAEEVIAFERQARAAQEARLKHYESRATVAIHYRIASVAQSVDVVSENRVFVHDGKQDYQEIELFVDGARWRGKRPPYLPFLQPEKVREVPLDIALDEGYRYTLVKRDRVDDRDCYVIAVDPKAEGKNLYRGRVSIDAQTFTRVRMEAVQTGVKTPLRSNQVTYRYGPVSTPAGEFWLPLEVDGQMVFEVLGRNLVVEREVRFSEFIVNGEDFGDRLALAYGSGRPLFRETDEGYYGLDAAGGQEVLRDTSTPRNTFLVMGANIGSDGVPGLPFAGVNFFDFNYRNSGTQVNLAWAGPFVNLTWTNPTAFRLPWSATPAVFSLEGTFVGVASREKNARAIGTSSRENVDIYHESITASLAVPAGQFVKCTLQSRLSYMNFDTRSDTDPTFVLPASTAEGGLVLRMEYNHGGYIVAASGEAARRSRWLPWGLSTNSFHPDDRSFTRLDLDVKKAFYLGEHRKLTFGIAGFEGRGLDRFSRFELGDFRSARVRGFNGSGIHFDRGLVADTSYAFTIAGALRLDVGLQSGWVQSPADFGPGHERLVGAGVAAEFSGPWSTLVNLRYGRAIASTLEDRGGGGDLRIIVFKTFDRWGRRKAAASTPSAQEEPRGENR